MKNKVVFFKEKKLFFFHLHSLNLKLYLQLSQLKSFPYFLMAVYVFPRQKSESKGHIKNAKLLSKTTLPTRLVIERERVIHYFLSMKVIPYQSGNSQ